MAGWKARRLRTGQQIVYDENEIVDDENENDRNETGENEMDGKHVVFGQVSRIY